MIIFRWSVWNLNRDRMLLLNHSIGTFQHFFQDTARYIIFTDSREYVLNSLKVNAEVYQYDGYATQAYLDLEATWRKWAPMCRFDVNAVELRVDADMFLIADPTELRKFCSSDNYDIKFLTTLEEFHAPWPYGNFASQLGPHFVPINAGLIGQYKGADLSSDLADAYHWWRNNVPQEVIKYHDDQGAVAKALEPWIKQHKVMLLPPARYRVVCPLNDPPVSSLDGLVLLHATYPEHPAFYQFIDQISKISGLEPSL